ncbi:hypothetical protein KAW38_02620 [Candidatus Micrarchaeota archaeon]|nr:hypothetical protein [Candidatus Micrarchaeota archaeon]
MFIAVLSDKPDSRKDLCRAIGKKTGEGDISFYSSNFQGVIRTLVEPSLYPDKLQPLLYTLSIADYVILIVEELNPYIGEIIVALDSLKKENGAILSQIELPVKGTVLENYKRISSSEEAKQEVLSLQDSLDEEKTIALVDGAFQVKSVGNVALGAVKSGVIKKHDKLMFFPLNSEIEIKTIQLNDKDVNEVSAGGRFGICYKGDPIERGILSSLSFLLADKIPGTFSKSQFYTNEIPKKIHVYSNFQFVGGDISSSVLSLEKPLAYTVDDRILILDPGNKKLRICGVFFPKT